MNFIFYKNNADNRKVNKLDALTQILILDNVIYKNDVDKGIPIIELTYNSILQDANYCYCSDLDYYYYLSEPIYSGQRVYYNLTVDLLMTYREDIKKLECIIARQENKFNAYLKDNRYPVLNKQDVNTLVFPKGFSTSEEMLLIVNGG